MLKLSNSRIWKATIFLFIATVGLFNFNCDTNKGFEIEKLNFVLTDSLIVHVMYDNKTIIIDTIEYLKRYEISEYPEMENWYIAESKNNLEINTCLLIHLLEENKQYRINTSQMIKEVNIYNRVFNKFNFRLEDINLIKFIILKSKHLRIFPEHSIFIDQSNCDSIINMQMENIKTLTQALTNHKTTKNNLVCFTQYQLKALNTVKNLISKRQHSFFLMTFGEGYSFLIYEYKYQYENENTFQFTEMRILNPINITQSRLNKF